MKKSVFSVLIILALSQIFLSCASKTITQRERNDTFIADLEPFYIDELHLYSKTTMGSPKVTDIEVSFSPRTNAISFKMKIGIDVIRIVLSYAERQKLFESANKYIDDYNNNLIKDIKPTKKNALLKSKTNLSWGVFGLTHTVNVSYSTNTEFLEAKKPYYRIKFDATNDPQDESATPAFSIYISPSQWEKIMEMCSQERLEHMTDDILAQAEEF